MRDNSVVIATTAGLIGDVLREKLRDAFLQVSIAATDEDLAARIKGGLLRFVFIEHCFYGYGTDVFIKRLVKRNRDIHVVVWAASEVKPDAAARFIYAGAESFISLRATDCQIEDALCLITGGRRYCPSDVEAVIDKKCVFPAIGDELTKREVAVLKLTFRGKRNNDIAESLSITVHGVKFHKKNIYRKCGGNTVGDIFRFGLERGVFDDEDF